jgi:hypothetical protein
MRTLWKRASRSLGTYSRGVCGVREVDEQTGGQGQVGVGLGLRVARFLGAAVGSRAALCRRPTAQVRETGWAGSYNGRAMGGGGGEGEIRGLRFRVGDALPADDPLARFILVV